MIKYLEDFNWRKAIKDALQKIKRAKEVNRRND